jgi:hypothetical protein
MTEFEAPVATLDDHNVAFIVVGAGRRQSLTAQPD